MSLNRRRFLTRTGLGMAGALAAFPGAEAHPPIVTPRSDPQPDDWEAVRDQFALTRDYIHLGGFLLASHPAPVREAIEAHRRGLDENPVDYLHTQGPRCEAAVLAAAAYYLGARPSEIALTDSTTMGLGLLYNGLKLRAGQEILTTQHDYYATRESLNLRSQRTGASIRTIPLYEHLDAVSEHSIVEAVLRALRPETRVIALTWVHSSTGLKLPIRRIADALDHVNAERDETDRALLCVDGVHGLGVENVAVTDLGCDFFVAGCHKWLFGPRGTGVLWGHPRAWPAVTPTIPSFTYAGTAASAMTPGGFHAFEHRWALADAFEFHQRLGQSRVAARIHELNRRFKEGLTQMPAVTLYTPRSEALSAGLICFDVAGLHPQTVVQRLAEQRIIATVTPYATSYARVGPSLLNSPEEIDRALAAIRSLA